MLVLSLTRRGFIQIEVPPSTTPTVVTVKCLDDVRVRLGTDAPPQVNLIRGKPDGQLVPKRGAGE